LRGNSKEVHNWTPNELIEGREEINRCGQVNESYEDEKDREEKGKLGE